MTPLLQQAGLGPTLAACVDRPACPHGRMDTGHPGPLSAGTSVGHPAFLAVTPLQSPVEGAPCCGEHSIAGESGSTNLTRGLDPSDEFQAPFPAPSLLLDQLRRQRPKLQSSSRGHSQVSTARLPVVPRWPSGSAPAPRVGGGGAAAGSPDPFQDTPSPRPGSRTTPPPPLPARRL